MTKMVEQEDFDPDSSLRHTKITTVYKTTINKKLKPIKKIVYNQYIKKRSTQNGQEYGFAVESRPITLVAAAAAKLLQSCPTLCDPIGGSPPGSPIPGILQARMLEWVAISFSNA